MSSPNHLKRMTARGRMLLIINTICMIMLLLTPFIANKPDILGIFPMVYAWAIIWGFIWILLFNIVIHFVKG